MIERLIEYLQCPKCGTESILSTTASPAGLVLTCNICRKTFPLTNNIPRFVDTIDTGFNQRWVQHPKFQADTEQWFWKKTGWTYRDITGKVVLDSGSGCGRFASMVQSCGAYPLCIDGSSAAVKAVAENVENAMVAQADMLQLPLKDSCVDMAYAIGTLHHTSDPQGAFNEMARVLKPGGQIAIWVYSKPVSDDTLIPAMNFLHDITKACPPEVLYEACKKHSLAVRKTYKIADFMAGIAEILKISASEDDEECISDTFDWHCPQYRSWHTFPEVIAWFEQAGLKSIKISDFPVSVSGVKA